jgi:HK97 family phage major capsid protein
METAELIAEFKAAHEETKKLLAEQKAETAVLKAQFTELEQKSVRRGGETFAGGQGEWGKAIIEADAFKTWAAAGFEGKARIKLEGKTISTIGSGSTLAGPMIAPTIITDPVALARRRLTVRNLLAGGQTNSNAVWFPRQTVRQNSAAVVAESALKPQSDFTMEIVQSPVRLIAHWVQTSRQAMDDAPALASFVDAELRYGLGLAEETELLLGDGTGEHLDGLVPQATSYSPPIVDSGASEIDTVLLALIQAEQALYPADGVVLNTLDWGKMRLLKDTMGRYLLGNPASPTPPYLWGVPLVVSPSMTSGSFLVGAFQIAAQIFDRMGVEVLASSESGTNFTKNEITIRGEERLALCVKRPQALITGTF